MTTRISRSHEGRIHVVSDTTYLPGSARDLYWQKVKSMDGWRYCDTVSMLEAQPPNLPKDGKVEKGSGWLSFFRSQRLIRVD